MQMKHFVLLPFLSECAKSHFSSQLSMQQHIATGIKQLFFDFWHIYFSVLKLKYNLTPQIVYKRKTIRH
jgi:hypothetical protein